MKHNWPRNLWPPKSLLFEDCQRESHIVDFGNLKFNTLRANFKVRFSMLYSSCSGGLKASLTIAAVLNYALKSDRLTYDGVKPGSYTN